MSVAMTKAEVKVATTQRVDSLRELRLRDMLFLQKGSYRRRFVHALISIALRLFFRRIELSRGEAVPPAAPLIFVLNHPNGLIDPALVFCALPRRVSFLAKSTLFELPIVRALLRTLEALPLYRRIDPGADMSLNQRTFAACRALLAKGRCIALFPEGQSHNATQLLQMRSGAARIALAAAASEPADNSRADFASAPLRLRIVPVGLYYTAKTSFRSEVLIKVGTPVPVPSVTLGVDGEPPRTAVQQLTESVAVGLRGVTLNTADEGELRDVARAEQLFNSLYEGVDRRLPLAETFYWLRHVAERLRLVAARTPERLTALRQRIASYEAELNSLGLAPEALAVSDLPLRLFFRQVLLPGLVLLMLSPMAIPGALIHLPAYLLATLFARLYQTHGPDAATASVKILAAICLMPLTWLTCAIAAGAWWGWRVGLAVLPAVMLLGYVALRVLEESGELSVWFGAGLTLLRRRALFLRLLLRRRNLQREIRQLIES